MGGNSGANNCYNSKLALARATPKVHSRLAMPARKSVIIEPASDSELEEAEELMEFTSMAQQMIPTQDSLDEDKKVAIALLLGLCGGIVLAHRQYQALLRS